MPVFSLGRSGTTSGVITYEADYNATSLRIREARCINESTRHEAVITISREDKVFTAVVPPLTTRSQSIPTSWDMRLVNDPEDGLVIANLRWTHTTRDITA